jgi:hypothetical protein
MFCKTVFLSSVWYEDDNGHCEPERKQKNGQQDFGQFPNPVNKFKKFDQMNLRKFGKFEVCQSESTILSKFESHVKRFLWNL